MNVVAASLMNVKRARREMERAFDAGDWEGVKLWDGRVGAGLDSAFDDPGRDNVKLVGELEKVLALYAQIVTQLPDQTLQQWMKKTQP
jgi:hypothetical protein